MSPTTKRVVKWAAIVVVVIAGACAFGVRFVMTGVLRGMQKRQMADIRAVAEALEAYAREQRSYPVFQRGGVRRLESALTPRYLNVLPSLDVWANELQVESTSTSYTIVSYGRDQVPDPPGNWSYTVGATAGFDEDLVFRDGTFVRYPKSLGP